MAMKIGYKQLVAEAEAEIKAYTAEEAKAKLGDENVQFIDVRDVRELRRDGKVPGAFHAPRGMLEFWVDPESPYHNEIFSSGKELVLFCAAGLRSALATQQLQRMGLTPIAHIDGGFAAWRKAGGPIEEPEKKNG